MSEAQQGLAPDCLQRALRSRFRQQVKPGVRHTTWQFKGGDRVSLRGSLNRLDKPVQEALHE